MKLVILVLHNVIIKMCSDHMGQKQEITENKQRKALVYKPEGLRSRSQDRDDIQLVTILTIYNMAPKSLDSH